jgi:hypothetical protein
MMFEFIFLTLYLGIILYGKIFFFFSESAYAASLIGKLDLFTSIVLFLLAIVFFFKTRAKTWGNNVVFKKGKLDLKSVATFLVIASVIGLSFYLNFHKVIQEWDSVALYDARAKFLESGVKFSDMTEFSKNDEISYYYLMYPPLTSIAHYFWYQLDTGLPVSIIYSISFLFFALGLFLLGRKFLGNKLGLVLVLLTLTNKDIFTLSILEYTNLPFTTNIVFAAFLLAEYLKTPRWWKYLYATLLISTSQWIRYLEPVWLLIAFVFLLVYIRRNNWLGGFLRGLLMVVPCIIGYLSWGYFTKYIAGSPSAVSISLKTISDPIIGLFTGKVVGVAFVFVKSQGFSLFIYLPLIIVGIMSLKQILIVRQRLFLWLFIVFSIVFYFVAMYFSSFQGDWWESLGGSIVRSSSFIIPVSLLFLLILIKDITGNYLRKNRKTIKK